MINAIIVRRQRAHETSLSNATRKAMVISLKATRRPSCLETQQERSEGIVSITMILILRQQLLSWKRQSPQCKRNGRKKKTLNAGNLRQIGKIHAPDLP